LSDFDGAEDHDQPLIRRRAAVLLEIAQGRWLLRASSLLLALGCAPMLRAADSQTSVPTFYRDVAPILFSHCTKCHQDGQIGAKLSLLSYESARAKAGAIRERVEHREMPPWPADPAASLAFRNDARLGESDIRTVVAWANGGAPRGEAADLPANPDPDQAWHHPEGRKPDAIVTLPATTVRPAVVVPYLRRLIKVPYTADKWVSAIEVRAGNAALLHHMGITEVELPDGVSPKELDEYSNRASQLGLPDSAYSFVRPVVTVPDGNGAYDMLGVYTPGTTFESYAAGSARLLKGGHNVYLNFNIHYSATDQQQTDLTKLAFWFEPGPPAHTLFRAPAGVKSLIVNGRELLTDDPGTKAEGTPVAIPPIAPNADNYELIGVEAYVRAVTFYQFQPHAHLRAKDFRYVVVYPDGREQTVLSVPRYAFHWQLAYDLKTPLQVPAGSKLIVTAHYDNSVHNVQLKDHESEDPLHNCGPDKTVYFRQQNQSWDEMFSPLIQYAVDVGPAPGGSALALIEAVGCLRQRSGGGWWLERAGDPAQVGAQATSLLEIRAAEARPLGLRSYRLLGLGVFSPLSHLDQKVVVRGVQIPSAGFSVNVTSLQSLPGGCS
jgi:hypothetical protein